MKKKLIFDSGEGGVCFKILLIIIFVFINFFFLEECLCNVNISTKIYVMLTFNNTGPNYKYIVCNKNRDVIFPKQASSDNLRLFFSLFLKIVDKGHFFFTKRLTFLFGNRVRHDKQKNTGTPCATYNPVILLNEWLQGMKTKQKKIQFHE